MTAELAAVLGSGNVVGIDPSEAFVDAARSRLPEVEIRVGPAEQLPFDDEAFDAALAQLVVNFMTDANEGLREMSRVTKTGGVVAGAVWDYGDGMTMCAPSGIRRRRSRRVAVFATSGTCASQLNLSLEGLWLRAGMTSVVVTPAVVTVSYRGFEELWAPFEQGIGPAGAYTVALPGQARAALKDEMRRRLAVGEEPFDLTARAWAAVGRVP